jgi:putative DNA primase/helicase
VYKNGNCRCVARERCSKPGKHPLTLNGLLDATTDVELIDSWLAKWPSANWAIRTGSISGVFVLDVDGEDGYVSAWRLAEKHTGDRHALERGMSTSTGNGFHFFIEQPAGVRIPNSVRSLGKGLDIRGDGGYALVEPSVHANGKQYTTLLERPLLVAPWLVDLVREQPKLSASTQKTKRRVRAGTTRYAQVALDGQSRDVATAPEGTRNDTLNKAAFRMGKLVGSNDIERDVAEATLTDAAAEAKLGEGEAARTIKSGLDAGVQEPDEHDTRSHDDGNHSTDNHAEYVADDDVVRALTDLGNAERFVDRHGGNFRFCAALGWLHYDGARWKADAKSAAYRAAADTVRSIADEAERFDELAISFEGVDDDARKDAEQQAKALRRWALQSEADYRQRSMLNLAQHMLLINVEQLDAHPSLLNVANGTLDLRTGELHEHCRDDLLTKIARVAYNPAARAPRWEAFLERVLPNVEVRLFLQRHGGYAIVGQGGEQVLLLLWGEGANGKTTYVEVMHGVLGDYAQQTPASTLLAKSGDQIPNDVARLRGARFVAAVETDMGRRLAEGLVKRLTGGDTLAARFLFHEYFEFRATFALLLATNHKPRIVGTDHAIWRRINMVPFTVVIPKDEQVKLLADQLIAEEGSGILSWIVQGALDWQARGLDAPDIVQAATEDYRHEQDTLGEFFVDRCTIDDTANVGATKLYDAYKSWCDSNGEQPMSQREFGLQLNARGFEHGPNEVSTRRRTWHGLRLNES